MKSNYYNRPHVQKTRDELREERLMADTKKAHLFGRIVFLFIIVSLFLLSKCPK